MKKSVLNENLFFSLTWDYLNNYLPFQNQYSDKTVKSYTDGLTVFRRYITDVLNLSIEEFGFEKLTYDFMLDYRNYLVKKGYKAKTVNHRICTISAYMRYAAMQKTELMQIYLVVSEVPYVKEPSVIKPIIEDENAIKMLLSAPKPSKIGIRDQLIMTLLYDTAIRADELIKLNYQDVNITAEIPYLRVFGKGSKERIVAITEKTVPLIKQYIEIYHKESVTSSIPFFYTTIKGVTGRMSERNVERILKKYGDILRKSMPDIPETIYPHMLRRTRATGWYRDGVPIETIALILGHSDAKTTRKAYAKPSLELLRNEMSKGTPPDDFKSEEPLWENDDELAKLCGIR